MTSGLIAVAEAAGADGKALIAAIVLAYDVYCSFCETVDINSRGWDQPLYNALGCVLGAGRLLGLTRSELANAVLADYARQVILICWHHGTIQTLATALKGTGATKWAGTVFDRVWLLDYTTGSNPAIQQFGQQLLFADEHDVPPKPW